MDFLKEELTKLVYDYSINGIYADEGFIYKALDLCISAFDISDYVHICEVANISDEFTYAGYNIEYKSVIIDKSDCLRTAIERVEAEKQGGVLTSDFLDYVKVNLNLINSVIHELTHACQYKKCLQGKDDFEKEVLELTLERNLRLVRGEELSARKILYFKSIDNYYHDDLYYIAMPDERMANLNGLEYEKDISKLLPADKKGNIEKYTELRLLLGQLQAYKDYSPTTFVTTVNEAVKASVGVISNPRSIIDIEKNYKKIAREHNFLLDDRLWLGLPIDKVDKQKINKKIDKIERSLKG